MKNRRRLQTVVASRHTHSIDDQVGAHVIGDRVSDGGLRAGEVRRLLLADVDQGRRQLRVVGKGGRERVVPVDDVFFAELAAFVEERRRAKVIPRFPDEKAALKLVFATMIRAADRWCRVSISDLERHQLTCCAPNSASTRPSQHRSPQNQPTQRHCRMISRPPIYRALRT